MLKMVVLGVWNLFYETFSFENKASTITEIRAWTTNKPSGENYKWYFTG